MKRVVVTGLGLLTSIGTGVEESWNNLISLKSGIKKITSFKTDDMPCKIAGYISDNVKSELIQVVKGFNVAKLFVQVSVD